MTNIIIANNVSSFGVKMIVHGSLMVKQTKWSQALFRGLMCLLPAMAVTSLGLEKNKILIRYYDAEQGQWKNRDGPECKSAGCHIEILIIENTIFLTRHSSGVATIISKASVHEIDPLWYF